MEKIGEEVAADELAMEGAKKKFVPPPKPVRTEQDWANIAYLEKLRDCIDEVMPEGLPMACIVKVLEYSEVPMAHDKYAMVTVYGPDDRMWKMCVLRGTAQVGDEMLFINADAALPVDDRWVDSMVCSLKERVYKFGFGIKVRRKLPITRRNIYGNNNGVLYPLDDFEKDLRNVRLGEDCSGILNVESATDLKERQNAKKQKPHAPDEIDLPPALRKKKVVQSKPKKTKASYSFLNNVRWMRKDGSGSGK